MVKDGKFRFTLQFGMTTQEELQAGKLLEQLGKRKSPVVVAALNEYLENHPEFHLGETKIQFHLAGPDQQSLENTIRRLIEERLGSGVLLPVQNSGIPTEDPKQVSADILDMLQDLDMFN